VHLFQALALSAVLVSLPGVSNINGIRVDYFELWLNDARRLFIVGLLRELLFLNDSLGLLQSLRSLQLSIFSLRKLLLMTFHHTLHFFLKFCFRLAEIHIFKQLILLSFGSFYQHLVRTFPFAVDMLQNFIVRGHFLFIFCDNAVYSINCSV